MQTCVSSVVERRKIVDCIIRVLLKNSYFRTRWLRSINWNWISRWCDLCSTVAVCVHSSLFTFDSELKLMNANEYEQWIVSTRNDTERCFGLLSHGLETRRSIFARLLHKNIREFIDLECLRSKQAKGDSINCTRTRWSIWFETSIFQLKGEFMMIISWCAFIRLQYWLRWPHSKYHHELDARATYPQCRTSVSNYQ